MKNKLISILAVVFLSLSLVNCASDTDNVVYSEEVSETQESPRPLIIEQESKESPQEKNPVGVYEGTITITGAGVEDICYEGIIMIQMDGDKIRIVSTDSIRSNFNDLF